jgi:polyhydroxyalkanoate synthesis repressor PhaR
VHRNKSVDIRARIILININVSIAIIVQRKKLNSVTLPATSRASRFKSGKRMKHYKKYPNRRLYDTEKSCYVTVEEIRKEVVDGQSITVIDSKTDKDLTRGVLLQIISEQEGEGHEPILTNRVMEQLIRFYGDSMQSLVSRYLEQSIMTFINQQEIYRKRMKTIVEVEPVALVRKALQQNMDFWTNLTNSVAAKKNSDNKD